MERIFTALLLLSLAACSSTPATPLPTAAPAPPASAPPRDDLSLEPIEVAFREELDAARARNLPLLIQEREYRNGSFRVTFYNASGRDIENLMFVLQPYDALGRLAGAPATARFGGPVRPSLSLASDLLQGIEAGLWESSGVDCVEIIGLRLSFPGEAQRDYSFDAVSRMYRDNVNKWCRFVD